MLDLCQVGMEVWEDVCSNPGSAFEQGEPSNDSERTAAENFSGSHKGVVLNSMLQGRLVLHRHGRVPIYHQLRLRSHRVRQDFP